MIDPDLSFKLSLALSQLGLKYMDCKCVVLYPSRWRIPRTR